MKAILNEVFFRDPFFHHFSVFVFVPCWIIKLKVGWHPLTASQVWNTKDNSRSRDSLLGPKWHICVSPLGFLLLTQQLSPLFVSLGLCEHRPPSLAQTAAWPGMKGTALQGLEQWHSLQRDKMCCPSRAVATGLGQPWPRHPGLFESQV